MVVSIYPDRLRESWTSGTDEEAALGVKAPLDAQVPDRGRRRLQRVTLLLTFRRFGFSFRVWVSPLGVTRQGCESYAPKTRAPPMEALLNSHVPDRGR